MKKLLLTFLIILFSLTSNVVWSADFQKGLTAYDNVFIDTSAEVVRDFLIFTMFSGIA